MTNLLSRFCKSYRVIIEQQLRSQLRRISSTRPSSGYEGDGKTTISFMDEEMNDVIVVQSFFDDGFILNNGAHIHGPILLFPNLIFNWKVNSVDEISPNSLTAFKLMEPKLDLLILGIGETGYWSPKVIHKLRQDIQQIGLKVEILPTKNAVATYNFMLADYRLVAGAFLPIKAEKEAPLLKAK